MMTKNVLFHRTESRENVLTMKIRRIRSAVSPKNVTHGKMMEKKDLVVTGSSAAIAVVTMTVASIVTVIMTAVSVADANSIVKTARVGDVTVLSSVISKRRKIHPNRVAAMWWPNPRF